MRLLRFCHYASSDFAHWTVRKLDQPGRKRRNRNCDFGADGHRRKQWWIWEQQYWLKRRCPWTIDSGKPQLRICSIGSLHRVCLYCWCRNDHPVSISVDNFFSLWEPSRAFGASILLHSYHPLYLVAAWSSGEALPLGLRRKAPSPKGGLLTSSNAVPSYSNNDHLDCLPGITHYVNARCAGHACCNMTFW